jgi:hypothetical protein
MNPDDRFYIHLRTLQNGPNRQTTYRNYKNGQKNYCFELNGTLKGRLDCTPFLNILGEMNDIIRAKNKKELTVYRMTSDVEFTPCGPQVALNEPFLYPAFLSTSRSIYCLQNFYPPYGIPTVLEINCPSNTTMALMENAKSHPCEEEILLGANSKYRIDNIYKITDAKTRQQYVGRRHLGKSGELYLISMSVVDNPPQLHTVNKHEYFYW